MRIALASVLLVLLAPALTGCRDENGGTAAEPPPTRDVVLVVSLNVLKPQWAGPDEPAWEARRQKVFDVVNSQAPDFLCTQEETDEQVSDILEAAPAYSDAGNRGRSGAIFYWHKRWELVRSGKEHFAEDPWYFMWALFREKASGRQIHIYTTHIPIVSQVGIKYRVDAAKKIARHISERDPRDVPVILTGDFNSLSTAPPMLYLTGLTTPARLVYAHYDILILVGKSRSYGIDHILTTPGMKVVKSGVAKGIGESGSDHPAVFAALKW